MTDIATVLREAREAMGLTLEEVAQRTYIKLPYLQALEDGCLEALPAPVYTSGYIRQVAKLLGLDGSALVSLYQQQERRGGSTTSSVPQRSQASMADLSGESFNPFKATFSPNGNGHANGRNGHSSNGHGSHGHKANGTATAPAEADVLEVRQAKLQAQQILGAAERDAENLVRGAERYADDVLATLEREIAQTLQTIQNGRQFLASRRQAGPLV